jgi:hypothetical protein
LKEPHPRGDCPSRAVTCDLVARACVRVPLSALADMRRRPGPGLGEKLPAAFLKHSDEQTVVGLAAVLQAIQAHGLDGTCFRDWAVLGAPCSQGRPMLAIALQKFLEEGAWGVSPHLIPHRSLHALSGTVSQALKIHGINFGVGGASSSTGEALLTSMAVLGARRFPGVWLVTATFDPDTAPDWAGQLPSGTQAVGLALALTPSRPEWTGPRLHFAAGCSVQGSEPQLPLNRLAGLVQGLDEPGNAPLVCAFDNNCQLEIERSTAVCRTVRLDAPGGLRPPHVSVTVETER